jgi:signal transduction histidine kinase
MSRVFAFLNRQPRMRVSLLGLLSVACLGALDYLTGHEISFSIFYLLPVAMVAWYVGRRGGILISCASAVSWLLAELLAGPAYSHPAIPFWNTLVRLGFFSIITYILSTLRVARQNQENLIHFVVHDLRAPLAIILTGLQIVEELDDETPLRDEKAIIARSISAGKRMLTLVDSLLDLSRLESGQMPVQMRPVGTGELVETSLAEIRAWAARKQVEPAAQVDTGAEWVQADSDLTVRILVNLLSNAVKYSPPESSVLVRVAADGPGMTVFSVTDGGPGIPEEWRGRIFDKFVSVEGSSKGVTAGTGLGLYFCQQAVKAQGGQIWLDEGQGAGTSIHFTLPTAGTRIDRRHPHPSQAQHRSPSGTSPVPSSERPVRHPRLGEES